MAKEEKKAIKLTDKVKIVATEEAKHMVAGQEYEVHPTQAELLKKKGWAVDPGKKAPAKA